MKRRLRKGKRATTRSPDVIRLIAPNHLTLENKKNRKDLDRLINGIHTAVSNNYKRICIDFKKLASMGPHATLLLWAELNRIKKKCPNVRLSTIQPENNKCLQVFSQIGLSKVLSCQDVDTKDEDVVHWRAVSGKSVDGEKYAEKLMLPYINTLKEDISQPLWVGVQEAMTNVIHHAYIMPRGDKLSSMAAPDDEWWMFSQEKDGFLTVLICDLGVGIPRTVPITKKDNLASVARWIRLGKRSDADILSAVLKKTVLSDTPTPGSKTSSRTGEANRGKGFYNIVKTVRSVPQGAVSIYSNHGRWHSVNQEEPTKSNFRTSIHGTIISWRIPIGATNE